MLSITVYLGYITFQIQWFLCFVFISETLTTELEQERKIRFSLQQKLKGKNQSHFRQLKQAQFILFTFAFVINKLGCSFYLIFNYMAINIDRTNYDNIFLQHIKALEHREIIFIFFIFRSPRCPAELFMWTADWKTRRIFTQGNSHITKMKQFNSHLHYSRSSTSPGILKLTKK